MKTRVFHELCDVYAVPKAYQQFCREQRSNPLALSTSYEEQLDLSKIPHAAPLVYWLKRSEDIFKKTGKEGLLRQYRMEETKRMKSFSDNPAVVKRATDKVKTFIGLYNRIVIMRKLPITTQVILYPVKAKPVSEAIMALHAGKLDIVRDYLNHVIEENGYLPEQIEEIAPDLRDLTVISTPAEKADLLLEAGIPFDETLNFMEVMESSKLPKLPEFLGVSPFIYEIGKVVDGTSILDRDGRTVGLTFWDDEITPTNNLEHSPRQDSVEERAVQKAFQYKEDERALRLQKYLQNKGKANVS